MIRKTGFVSCSAAIIMVTVFIICAGCASSQSTKNPVNSDLPSTTTLTSVKQTIVPTVTSGIPGTTLPHPADPVTVVPSTTTQATGGVRITLNSAEKKVSFGNGTGKAGRTMLLLDITLRNNDKSRDFEYTDASFTISYTSGKGNSIPSITSEFAKQLVNPLLSGTVPPNSEDTGKLLFGVNESSDSYILSVVDPTGEVLASIDNIHVP